MTTREKLLKKRDWKIIPMTPGETLLERMEGRGYSYKVIKAENMPYVPTLAEKIDFGAVKPKSRKIGGYIRKCWMIIDIPFESDDLRAKSSGSLMEKRRIINYILRGSVSRQLEEACKYFCGYECCWLKVTAIVRNPGSRKYTAHVQITEKARGGKIAAVGVPLTSDAQIIKTTYPLRISHHLQIQAKLPTDIFRERDWKIVEGGHIKKVKMAPELTEEELTNFRKSRLSWTEGEGQRVQYVLAQEYDRLSDQAMAYRIRESWLKTKILRKFKGLAGYNLFGNLLDVRIYPDLENLSAEIKIKGVTFNCRLVGKKRKKLVVGGVD